MRPAVLTNLLIQTGQDAETVRAYVDGLIYPTGTSRTVGEATTTQLWHRNLHLVNAYAFCPSAADADSLVTQIVNTWTNPPHRNRIEAGSWVKRIDSYEDEGGADVVVSTQVKA
jgi:hypothetical protein